VRKLFPLALFLFILSFFGIAAGAALKLPADRILRISGDSVEFEHHGSLPLSEAAEAFHHWEGEALAVPLDAVKVGFKEVAATLKKGEVFRLDVYDPLYIKTILVALTTDEFRSIEHKELSFTPTSKLFVEEKGTGRGFIVEEGEEAVVYAKEGKLLFKDGKGGLWEFAQRLYLSAPAGGLIQINTFLRGTTTKFYPRYRGRFELSICGEEHFLAINEVDLEEYLYQVVPSEMPKSWPLEALKAQAVAARTFAVAQAVYSRQGHLGYHVRDDTSSQVYNNQPEAEAASQAIDETAGLILAQKDGTIGSAYFYSTSAGGSLETLAEWENTELWAAEGNSPWFRWQCTFSQEDLKELFKNEGLGEILGLKITERDDRGRVSALEVKGTLKSVVVRGELTIRNALAPKKLVRLADVLTNEALLPSAFFLVEQSRDEKGRLKSAVLYGGGSGHGLGMSQWGAKGLAEAGFDYESILKRYYPNTRLLTHSERLRYGNNAE